MPPVVVAGSPNSFEFVVVDFANTSSPTRVLRDPGFNANCVVDCDGVTAVVGAYLGSRVQRFDISNPAAPVALPPTVDLPGFGGIGAVAIRGSLVVAAELNGFRVALIDFSQTPPGVVTASTSQGGFAWLAFTAARRVVGSGLNAPPVFTEVEFPVSGTPVVTPFFTATSPFNLNFSSVCLDADPAANVIAVGNINGMEVALLDATTKAQIGRTAVTSLGSVQSVAVSGRRVLAGSPNSFDLAWISNFESNPPTVTSVNTGYAVGAGGGVTALQGTTGAAGFIVATGVVTPVKLLNLAQATPQVTGTADGVPSASTVALGPLAGAPPVAQPRIEVTPTDVAAFPATRVNTTSPTIRQITIRNTGTAALNVTGIQVSNTVFTVTPATLPAIQPNQTRTLEVGFRPTVEGLASARLTITSNDPSQPTVTVALSGTGAQPHLRVSPSPLDFDGVPVCLSADLALTLENPGGLDLTISSIAAPAPYRVNTPSAVITPGGSRTVLVTFEPTDPPRQQDGTLTITSDDPADAPSSGRRTVNLIGRGLPTPPPAISVTPMSLDFGAVPRQFFAGMRLTVANTSPCQGLSVTLEVTPLTSPFFVTVGDPTTVPMTRQHGPVTVGPTQSARFAVVFAPTDLGAAPAGRLRITHNDPSRGPVEVTLQGRGVEVAPAALELVLDRSGSMAAPAPGGTQMDALKTAVKLFADLVIPGQGDEMGAVEFDDQVAVLTPRGTYDSTKQGAIKQDVDGLQPRGWTSIGGGLQLGRAQLDGSTVARKVILVFTDGRQNTPPEIAEVEPGVLAAGMEVYAVGLGRPEFISSEALSELAASSNGRFFLADDPLILRKHFAHVLADAFRQQMAFDPVMTLTQAQVVTVPVWITDCERRISFVLNWDDPASDLALEVEAPDGTRFGPTSPNGNQLVRYGQPPGYRYCQIALPPLDPGSGRVIGPQRLGRWLMRITATRIKEARQRCTTSVLVESDLEMKVSVEATGSGHPLRVAARILRGGSPVKDASITARVTAPTKTLADLLTPALVKSVLKTLGGKPVDDRSGVDLLDRVIKTLSATGKRVIPTRTTKHTLKPEGKGLFVLELAPPLVEGAYQFELEAVGQACGGTFQRYTTFTHWVGRKADRGKTKATVASAGVNAAVITVVPRDSRGRTLGPGLGRAIGGAVPRGQVVGVVDNLDGSYTLRVAWSRRARTPKLALAVGDARLTAPLTRRSSTKRAKSS